MANEHYSTLKSNGHEAAWVEVPGLGHNFAPDELPASLAWLQTKTLCGRTVAGRCSWDPVRDGGPSQRDGAQPAINGFQTSWPEGGSSALDYGVAPSPLAASADAGAGGGTGPGLTSLVGGCSLQPAGRADGGLLVSGIALLVARLSRRTRRERRPRSR